jgi:hypothetical protein
MLQLAKSVFSLDGGGEGIPCYPPAQSLGVATSMLGWVDAVDDKVSQ